MNPLKYKIQIGILVFATVFRSFGFAQDTLNLRNGNVEIVKVSEISTLMVKYKKFENPDGPSYTELKNDIYSITYKNGIIERFEYQAPVKPTEKQVDSYVVERKSQPKINSFGKTKFIYGNEIINNSEMHSVLLNLNDRKISEHINLAQKQAKWQYIGFGFFPCALAALVIAGESGGGFDDAAVGSSIMGVAGVACFATSITLKVKRNKNEATAIKLYNQKY